MITRVCEECGDVKPLEHFSYITADHRSAQAPRGTLCHRCNRVKNDRIANARAAEWRRNGKPETEEQRPARHHIPTKAARFEARLSAAIVEMGEAHTVSETRWALLCRSPAARRVWFEERGETETLRTLESDLCKNPRRGGSPF